MESRAIAKTAAGDSSMREFGAAWRRKPASRNFALKVAFTAAILACFLSTFVWMESRWADERMELAMEERVAEEVERRVKEALADFAAEE